MGSLILDGETLGQKHRQYNKFVEDYISTSTSQEIKNIDYNEADIDNLFKIDIACKQKNVDYVLEVLKCEDMLYVSRAIKQSVWLITDTKYADIINPDYLYTQLLPQMMSKAGHKLILTIRLHLKDEKRVEMFYKYYEDRKEYKTAVKWLPNCSVSYIENKVEKRIEDISKSLMKRLCEKSFKVLEICARTKYDYYMEALLKKTAFILKKDVEKYLTFLNSQSQYVIPKLSRRSTKTIMKVKPDIILDNFQKFSYKIDIPTFAKFFKGEEIKDFLTKHLANKNIASWFTLKTINHFIIRMPSDSQFDFIKRIFIDKGENISEEIIPYGDRSDLLNDGIMFYSSNTVPQSSNANLYKWYKFAPFPIAYNELKKLIRIESNPSERNEIFAVLVTCAKRNSNNLRTVLKYYRDKHMNEPFRFKSHFVNIVLSQSNAHRFDDETWTILNDIFCSLEVYSDSTNNVQTCLKYIIIRKVLHDTKVPDVVEKKFKFDTLISFQRKLNDEEKDKVFNYLYQFIISKIENLAINSKSDLNALIEHTVSVLNLLNDWKKNLLQYSIIVEKIREIIDINNRKSWNEDLSVIYNVNKSWRKHMFKESLFLHPTPESCINALKHGPETLQLCEKAKCLDNSIIAIQFLQKLRVYWPQTLAKSYENTFLSQLNDQAIHALSVQALCVLLPKNQLNDILIKYIPHDYKINWSEIDEFTLSIQKCFAKYMLLARPHPPIDTVLLYAKGDYLQFVLPSVNSIMYNISNHESIKHIPRLLDAPVSLQKHSLKIAFSKLKVDIFLPICLNTWKTTKNSSIRATVFKLVFDLLCKGQNEQKIEEIWLVLATLIDNLTHDENRIIYVTLGRAEKVPLQIKQAFCIKSYRYLKSLPPKANPDKLSESVISSMKDIMESLDLDFAVEVIFNSFDKMLTKQTYELTSIISTYLLSTKSEAIQTQRFEKIFIPVLEKYVAHLKDEDDKQWHLRNNFNNVLTQLLVNFGDVTMNKNMITPIKLYGDIHNELKKNLSGEDYYVLLMTWKLAAKFMHVINNHRVITADENQLKHKDDTLIKRICLEAAPEFGKVCMEQLKEEVSYYFPSIYSLFSEAVTELFNRFGFTHEIQLDTLKAIQDHADITEGHLLVLILLPDYVNDSKDKEACQKILQAMDSHPSAEVKMHYQQKLRIIENIKYSFSLH